MYRSILFSLAALIVSAQAFASDSSLLEQAKALGAPMSAVQRALALSKTSTYSNKTFAVFDISQVSGHKRFYLFDPRAGKVQSFFVAHGKANGGGKKATSFRGFQRNHDMTPLGPLRTAGSTQSMAQYSTITDRYTGRSYGGLTTLWLEGTTSYNSYINNATSGFSRVVWIMHPAWYVTEGYRKNFPGALGRSLGCIAMDPKVSNYVFGKLAGGALVYVTVGNQPIGNFL